MVDYKSFLGTHIKRNVYIYRRTHRYAISRCLFFHGPRTFGFSIRINYYYCAILSPYRYILLYKSSASSFSSYIYICILSLSPNISIYRYCWYIFDIYFTYIIWKRKGISHLRKDFRLDDIITRAMQGADCRVLLLLYYCTHIIWRYKGPTDVFLFTLFNPPFFVRIFQYPDSVLHFCHSI